MIDPLKVLHFLPAPHLALVGSGGKTTWMFALASALLQQYPTVLLTSSTHLASWQAIFADHHLVVNGQAGLSVLEEKFPSGVALLTGPAQKDGRIGGLDLPALAALQGMARAAGLPLIVEADGSRQRPLKAPAAHEPVIPDQADIVLVMAGLRALNQPLTDTWVHRPRLFSELSGIELGERVTKTGLTKMLISPNGGLKDIPSRAHKFAFLTQANNSEVKSQAGSIAADLLAAYDTVLIGETGGPAWDGHEGLTQYLKNEIDSAQISAVHKPIAGIVLAAGGASRFEGRLKQLLDWEGVPLVRHVAQRALEAGLDPVIAVTGAEAPGVLAALAGLPIEIVHNPDWEKGQSTSIRAAVGHLSNRVGAVVFMLVDQPQIPAALVKGLMDTHRSTLSPIVAPLIDGERGNPVLFDKITFDNLKDLRGDVGGRAVFSRYSVTWVPWHDGRMRLDIDTHSDYLKLIAEMGSSPPGGGSLNQTEG